MVKKKSVQILVYRVVFFFYMMFKEKIPIELSHNSTPTFAFILPPLLDFNTLPWHNSSGTVKKIPTLHWLHSLFLQFKNFFPDKKGLWQISLYRKLCLCCIYFSRGILGLCKAYGKDETLTHGQLFEYICVWLMLSILYSQRIKKGVEESGVRIWFFSLRQNAVKKIIFLPAYRFLSFRLLMIWYWVIEKRKRRVLENWALKFEAKMFNYKS